MPAHHRLHDLLHFGLRNVLEDEIPDPGPDTGGGGTIKTLAGILDHRIGHWLSCLLKTLKNLWNRPARSNQFRQSRSIGNRCTAPIPA